MSILACITIYECNGCKTTLGVQTDAEYKSHRDTWYEGLFVDYCPLCRELPEHEPRILSDQAARSHAAVVITRVPVTEDKKYASH